MCPTYGIDILFLTFKRNGWKCQYHEHFSKMLLINIIASIRISTINYQLTLCDVFTQSNYCEITSYVLKI